jgi:hypothetical protein
MKINWSEKHNLANYQNAPRSPGVYIIGICDNDLEDSNDTFLGNNFPNQFLPKYVGISKKSIRTRLSCHSRKRGNRNVKEYIEANSQENLQFVYFTTSFTEIEHGFLFGLNDLFVWNIKKDEGQAFFNYINRITT